MKLGEYIKETQAELRHVTWPSRTEVVMLTALVISVSVVVAAYLGLLDGIFTAAIERIV